jgi:CBS domain-containing protein
MVKTEKSFVQLTAEELMSCPVETVGAELPLRDAARLLSRARISGAPVVDAEGRCIGVISATDFVHWAEQRPRGAAPWAEPVCVHSEWQITNPDALPHDQVRWHMTPGPVTASPTTSIIELARMMLEAHIHRIIVVDEERRPVGIVASTDILAAVAFREHDTEQLQV